MQRKIGALRLGLTFAGCFLGAGYVSGQELWQYFGAFGTHGLLGLALGMLFLRLKDRTLAGRPEWTPHITAVYEDRSAVDALGCPGRKGL